MNGTIVRAAVFITALLLALPALGGPRSEAHPFPQDPNGHVHINALIPRAAVGACGVLLGGVDATGTTTDPTTHAYVIPSLSPTPGNAPDNHWVQDTGDASAPLVWDMASATNSVYLFPTTDHPPIPEEAFESTVYGGPTATGPWTVGDLALVYDEGFAPDPSVSDDYVQRWDFPAAFRYVAVSHGGPGAQLADGDNEIDAVCAAPASVGETCSSGETICKDVRFEDADGDGLIERGEEVSFLVTITITNTSPVAWNNVVVSDRFGGEIDVTGGAASQGTFTLDTKGNSEKEFLEWLVGTLAPGASATLVLTAETDTNPGGHQEYTSCGVHEFNSGAVLKARDPNNKQQSFESGGVSLRVWCPGRLFAATDTEEFSGQPLPDRLAVYSTNGPQATLVSIESTDVYVNGLEAGPGGTLFVGDPYSNDQSVIEVDGDLVSQVDGPLVNGSCCNEDIAFDGTHLWRADYIEGPLFKFLPDGTLAATYAQTDVVGATFVGATLWLSKWGAQQVGTFDPGTNTFTPMFTTSDLAGGLAYDAGNNVLWVGLRGGLVQAWDLTASPPTLIPGSTFQPFGAIPDTIDGLAFMSD